MKQLCLLLVTGLLSLSQLAGQGAGFGPKWEIQRNQFGVKAGLNISTIRLADVADAENRTGGSFALVARLPLGDMIALQPEFAYSTKGAVVDYQLENVFSGEVSYNLSYFELPIILQIRLGKIFQIEGGAYASILLNADFDYDGTFTSGFGELSDSALNELDYGAVGGVSFYLKRLALSLRYYYGLQTLPQEDYAETFLQDGQNGVIQIGGTVYFGGEAKRRGRRGRRR